MNDNKNRISVFVLKVGLIVSILVIAYTGFGNLIEWPSYESDLWLLKLDSLGDTVWTQIFSEDAYIYKPTCVFQYPDDGYLIRGKKYRYSWSFFAIKTDNKGCVLWHWEKGNGYIIPPRLTSDSLAYREAATWVKPLKDDTLWFFRANQMRHIFRTSDGNRMRVNTVEDSCVRLIKEDSDYDNIWRRLYCFGDGARCYVSSVNPTADGGYIITGEKRLGGIKTEETDLLLIKADSVGEKVWIRTYGIDQRANCGGSASSTSDGGYIVVTEVRY